MKTIEEEQVRKPKGQSAGLWLIRTSDTGNRILGMLEKFKNTHTETHPWKAYAGYGHDAIYLGAFYDDDSVPDDGDTQYGGKQAAINAILLAIPHTYGD